MKLVIFDMDGLLVDSEKVYAEGWKKGLLEKGYDISYELIEDLSGRSAANNNKVIFEIVKDMDLVMEIRKIREDYFCKQLEDGKIELMPYAFQLIQYLKNNNIKIALATTSHKPRVREVLITNNVSEVFDYICCGDEVEKVKPNPDIYLSVLNKSGLSNDEAIALEDSLTGAKAAIAAKIPVAIISKKIAKNNDLAKGLEVIGIFESLEDFYIKYMKEGKHS